MPTAYVGNAAAVAAHQAPGANVPDGGDARTASSVDPALETAYDYLAFLQANAELKSETTGAAVTTYRLLREWVVTGVGTIRLYANSIAGLVLTLNARWDDPTGAAGTHWHYDVPGTPVAARFDFGGGLVTTSANIFPAGYIGADNWLDAAWTLRSAETTTGSQAKADAAAAAAEAYADASWRSTLVFGSEAPGNTHTADYLEPGYSPTAPDASGAVLAVPVARAGKLRNLYAQIVGSSTNGNGYTITVTKNGVATALTFLLASNGGAPAGGSDVAHTIDVAAGDVIGVTIQTDGGVTVAGAKLIVSVEYAGR